MRDPMITAFEIQSPFKHKSVWFPEGYRKTLITIWHVDPERDGTDDSCGWFMRSRHGDPKALERIVKRFESDWDSTFSPGKSRTYNCGLFRPDGLPHLSVAGIAVNLFFLAALEVFGTRDKAMAWIHGRLAEILLFAENPTDSLHDGFTRKFAIGCGEPYTRQARDERIRDTASCIYSWILRDTRPWYKHPRWHFWHWKIQVHPVQKFKRWVFSRCAKCGQRFNYGECPVSHQWDGTGPLWFRTENGVFHHKCAKSDNV